MNNERVYSYILEFNNMEKAETFKAFQRVSIYKGKDFMNVLHKFMQKYVDKNKPDFTLVPEKVLLEELKKEGLDTTRTTLRKYRVEGILKRTGESLWFSDGHNIFYDLEGTIEFMRKRKTK